MELTREEREQVRAYISEMIAGVPITDDELENLARESPAAFYVITKRALGIMEEATTDEVLRALPDNLLEDLQAKFRDFMEQSDPHLPDTWDPDILCLTERLMLDGRSADSATGGEMSRAVFELMSLTFLEWKRRCG
jgi:hypothetical protein